MTGWSTPTEFEPTTRRAGVIPTTHRSEVPEVVMRITSGPRTGQLLRVPGTKFAIGSGAGCTLQLRSSSISPIHVFGIHGVEGTLVRAMAEDTRLNGRSFIDAWLQVGDYLSVGPVDLEILGGVVSLDSILAESETACSQDKSGSATPSLDTERLINESQERAAETIRELRVHEHRRMRRFLQELRYHRLSSMAPIPAAPVLPPATPTPPAPQAETIVAADPVQDATLPNIARDETESCGSDLNLETADAERLMEASVSPAFDSVIEPQLEPQPFESLSDEASINEVASAKWNGESSLLESFRSESRLNEVVDQSTFETPFATSVEPEENAFPTPEQARQSLVEHETQAAATSSKLNLLSLFSALQQAPSEAPAASAPVEESSLEEASTKATFADSSEVESLFGLRSQTIAVDSDSMIERVSYATTSYSDLEPDTQEPPITASMPQQEAASQETREASPFAAHALDDLNDSAESAYDARESTSSMLTKMFESESRATNSAPSEVSALDRIRQSLASLLEEGTASSSSNMLDSTTDEDSTAEAIEDAYSREEVTSETEEEISPAQDDEIAAAETSSEESETDETPSPPSQTTSEPASEADPLERLRYLQSLSSAAGQPAATQQAAPQKRRAEDTIDEVEETPAQPEIAPPSPRAAATPAPARPESHTPARAGEDDEESIDAYMAKLLARVGGTSTQPVTESNDSKPRGAEPLLKQTFQKELEEREEEFKVAAYVPRTAPERMEDLKALRDVANATARAAIDTSRRKKKSAESLVWVIGGIVALVIGGMLLKLSTSPFSANFVGTLICLGSCGYCIRRAIQTRGGATPQRLAPELTDPIEHPEMQSE